METQSLDYRQYLQQKVFEKSRDRSGFSLRNLARRSQLSHSLLSQVLNRKRNLSVSSARKVSQGLALDEMDAQFFCDLVEYEGAKDEQTKKFISDRIIAYTKTKVETKPDN